MSTALLALGYPLAVAVLVRFRSVLRRRDHRSFAALEVGTAAIAMGWALRRRPSAAVVNAFFFVAFGVAWWATGRRPR